MESVKISNKTAIKQMNNGDITIIRVVDGRELIGIPITRTELKTINETVKEWDNAK